MVPEAKVPSDRLTRSKLRSQAGGQGGLVDELGVDEAVLTRLLLE